MILKIDRKVDSIDLSPFAPLMEFHTARHLVDKAGVTHYRLLAYLSSQLPPSIVIDVGTCHGASAIALAYNKKVEVITYDVVDRVPASVPSYKNLSNTHLILHQDFTVDLLPYTLQNAPLIFLDIDPHDGIVEADFVRKLKEKKFRGVLLLDDINLNDGMRKFFTDIILPKYTLNGYGSETGTGAVIFDSSYVTLEISQGNLI